MSDGSSRTLIRLLKNPNGLFWPGWGSKQVEIFIYTVVYGMLNQNAINNNRMVLNTELKVTCLLQ